MTHIALIGASGRVGGQILEEALSRGHTVTGIVRQIAKLPARLGLTPVGCDLSDTATIVGIVLGANVLVVSIRWSGNAAQVIETARLARIRRLLIVINVGCLESAPGVRVMDLPDFPAKWRMDAEGAARALHTLRGEQQLDWVAFSPSWTMVPGKRTGTYRIGGDQLLRDAQGVSRISREDFAAAVIDEIEQPRHHRQCVTVGY